MKILYVDDEPINLKVFEANFKRYFTVLTAPSPGDALNVLSDDSGINIVISDMNMPKMNGIEFIKKAKEDYSDIAYFILTGFDISEEIERALNEKLIFQYFSKPLNVKLIMSELQKLLDNN